MNSPPNCVYSCLELACLFGLEVGIIEQLMSAVKATQSSNQGRHTDQASTLRALHFLLLRGEHYLPHLRCVLDKLDAGIFASALLQSGFSAYRSVCTGSFLEQVIVAHDGCIGQVTTQLQQSTTFKAIHRAFQELCSQSKQSQQFSKSGTSSTPLLDLKRCTDALCRASLGDFESMQDQVEYSSIFDLCLTSKSDALCAVVMQFLATEMVNGKFVLRNSTDAASSQDEAEIYFESSTSETAAAAAAVTTVSTVQSDATPLTSLIIDACRSDVVSFLVCLEDTFTKAQKHSAPIPTWCDVVFKDVSVDGELSNALEVAVEHGSEKCIKYFLSMLRRSNRSDIIAEGVEGEENNMPRETFSNALSSALLVKAISKSTVSEPAALSMLKYLIPSKHDVRKISNEFVSLEEFLTCTSFTDSRSQVVVHSGETLLHLCCRRGHALLVQHLLLLEADPLVKDSCGYTAVQCSIAFGHAAVTKLLYPHCSVEIHQASTEMPS